MSLATSALRLIKREDISRESKNEGLDYDFARFRGVKSLTANMFILYSLSVVALQRRVVPFEILAARFDLVWTAFV